jgi:hypothetical protein
MAKTRSAGQPAQESETGRLTTSETVRGVYYSYRPATPEEVAYDYGSEGARRYRDSRSDAEYVLARRIARAHGGKLGGWDTRLEWDGRGWVDVRRGGRTYRIGVVWYEEASQ